MASAAQPNGTRLRLGEMLIREGTITPEQLQHALDEQRSFGGRLGRHLVELGYINETVLLDALARQLHIPRVDLDAPGAISPEAVRYGRSDLSEQWGFCPISFDTKRQVLLIAVSDPDPQLLADIESLLALKVEPRIAPADAIDRSIRRTFHAEAPGGSKRLAGLQVSRSERQLHDASPFGPPPAPAAAREPPAPPPPAPAPLTPPMGNPMSAGPGAGSLAGGVPPGMQPGMQPGMPQPMAPMQPGMPASMPPGMPQQLPPGMAMAGPMQQGMPAMGAPLAGPLPAGMPHPTMAPMPLPQPAGAGYGYYAQPQGAPYGGGYYPGAPVPGPQPSVPPPAAAPLSQPPPPAHAATLEGLAEQVARLERTLAAQARALRSLVEVLVDKGLLSKAEMARKQQQSK